VGTLHGGILSVETSARGMSMLDAGDMDAAIVSKNRCVFKA
jgi:hypothetical protein